MKTRMFILLMIIGLISTPAFADAVVFSEGPSVEFSQISVLNQDRFNFGLNVNSVNVARTWLENDFYARFELEGSGYTRIVGQPEIPVYRRFVQVPVGAEITVDVTGKTRTLDLSDLTDANYVMPVQESREKCDCTGKEYKFEIDEAVYLQDMPIFDGPVRIVDEVILRGRRIAVIEIRPINYNPTSGRVEIYTELNLDVAFTGSNWPKTMEVLDRYRDIRTDLIARSFLINDTMYDTKTEVDYLAPSLYLVIGSSGLINSDIFAEWVRWKTSKGHIVQLVDVNETGGNPAGIVNFVTDAYLNWQIPPSFLLLVGDTNTVPHKVGTGMSAPATDLYYSTVDGGDIFADIGVGRFSAADQSDLRNIVKKTLDYEQGQWQGHGWLSVATFMASVDRNTVTEGTHNAVCSSIFGPAGINCEKLYSAKGATTNQAINAFNEGRSFVTFSGHGEVTAWVDGPVVTDTQVEALHNDVYPFVSSFSCLTGKYQNDQCFAETWIRASGGAVAMWASSVTSLWDEDDILEKGQMWGLFNGTELPNDKGVIYEEIPWLSGFTDYGKTVLYQWASGGGNTVRYFEMYNLFGDPETMARTLPPISMNVDCPEKVEIPADSLTLSVNVDEPFVLVGITVGGKLVGSALVEPGSKASIPLFEQITDETVGTVTITGHNLIPHIDEIIFTNEPLADDDDTVVDDDDDIDDDTPDPDGPNDETNSDSSGNSCGW